jgi:hypothetical protein
VKQTQEEKQKDGESINAIMFKLAEMVTIYGDLRVYQDRKPNDPKLAGLVNDTADDISRVLREVRDAWRGAIGLPPFVATKSKYVPEGTTIH